MAFLPEVLAQERKGKEIKMVVHFRKGLSFARVRKWNPGTKKQECENKGQELEMPSKPSMREGKRPVFTAVS